LSHGCSRLGATSHGGADNRVVLTFVPNGESADDDEEED